MICKTQTTLASPSQLSQGRSSKKDIEKHVEIVLKIQDI